MQEFIAGFEQVAGHGDGAGAVVVLIGLVLAAVGSCWQSSG